MPSAKHFHVLTMGGGPHVNGLEIFLDGKPLKGVTSLEVTANHGDAIRLKLEMIVEVSAKVEADTTLELPLNIEDLPPHMQTIASDLMALVESQKEV